MDTIEMPFYLLGYFLWFGSIGLITENYLAIAIDLEIIQELNQWRKDNKKMKTFSLSIDYFQLKNYKIMIDSISQHFK